MLKSIIYAAVFSAFAADSAAAATAPMNPISISMGNLANVSMPVRGSMIACYDLEGAHYFGKLQGSTALQFKAQKNPAKYKKDLKTKLGQLKKQIKALKKLAKTQKGKSKKKTQKKLDKVKKQRYQRQLDQLAIKKCADPEMSVTLPVNPFPAAIVDSPCPDFDENGRHDGEDDQAFLQSLASGGDFDHDGISGPKDLVAYWEAAAKFNEAPASVCSLCANLSPRFYASECASAEECGIASSSAQDLTNQIGPLLLYPFEFKSPMVTFYIVSDGTKAAKLQLTPVYSNTDAVATVEVLDPDENIIYWDHYEDPAGSAPETRSGSGIEPMLPEAFALPKSGVYQVRVMGNHYVRAALFLAPGTKYGYSMQNGGYSKYNWQDAPTTMYTWAPVHRSRSMRLKMTAGGGQSLPSVFDLTTNTALSTSELFVPADAVLEGHLWRLDFPSQWAFNAHGFPLILSPDAESAEAIRASVERIPSGPLAGGLVAHKFQLELVRLLPLLLEHVGSSEDLLNVPGPSSNQDCLNPTSSDDYFKYYDLLGYYSGVVTSARWSMLSQPSSGLPYQNLDPESAWAGTIGTPLLGKQACTIDADCNNGSTCSSGRCSQAFNSAQDRWDLLRTHTYAAFDDDSKLRTLYAGPSINSEVPMSLAFCAVTSTPCNPWGPLNPGDPLRYPELLYRSMAAIAADMIALGEDITPRGIGSDEDTYPGVFAFATGNQLMPVYRVAAPHLESVMSGEFCGQSIGSRFKKIWGNALRRVVDRSYNEYLTSSMNQSSHFLTGFQEFAMGSSGLPFQDFYRLQARTWAQRFFDGANAAGYFQESTGPDASYTGMTHWHLGTYYGLTKLDSLGADSAAFDALQTSYTFYNHTAAPERDGRMLGACNFNHRIGTGLHLEQWGGAKGLAEDVPAIAKWTEELVANPNAYHSYLISSANSLEAYAPNAHLEALGMVPSKFMFLNSSERPSGTIVPAQESSSYIRNFGNQLIAVKKPGYFTSIYVGKPAAGNEYLGHKEELRDPLSLEDHVPELGESINPYLVTPFLGGGMSLLWSNNYGNSIMTANWSPLTHHGLVATTSANKRYWEHYFATNFTLDSQANQLELTGLLEGSNLWYQRRYTFHDDHIEVYLKLTAFGDVSLNDLVENIPLATCTRADCDSNNVVDRKRYGATIVNSVKTPISGNQTLSQFGVFDDDDNGMMVNLDSSRNVRVYPHGLRQLYYGDELQIGRVQIVLPNSFTNGQIEELTYELWPQ